MKFQYLYLVCFFEEYFFVIIIISLNCSLENSQYLKLDAFLFSEQVFIQDKCQGSMMNKQTAAKREIAICCWEGRGFDALTVVVDTGVCINCIRHINNEIRELENNPS